ncbi:MAG: alpha/beta fold hydrolase [Bdellovibrionota bacterium]
MKRILALGILFLLSACTKSQDEKPLAAGQTTQVNAPSAAEVQAVRAAILFGHGVAPGEEVRASAAGTCADFVAKYPDFVSGTLDVPEDWDHADTSPKIKIFYYWRKGPPGSETRAPVVFYNGGPSSDSHSSAEVLSSLPFTKETAFVFLDQRGTGCSSPYPTALDDATAQRLTKWGASGIVRDSEALRKLLFGDQKWRAYGQSYGGFIVHRYLEIAPEGLDRGIAHGSSIMGDAASWMVERIRSQQRVGATYFLRNPGDQATLKFVRSAIPDTQCWQNSGGKVCGGVVLDSLTLLLGFQDSWPSLHQWISKLKGADGKVNVGVINSLVRTFVFGEYAQGGLAADVISKMEIAPGYSDKEGCSETMKRLRAAGENPDNFDINECRLLGNFDSPFDALLAKVNAAPISLDRIDQNIVQGGPEFFLFSGQQDVFVPFATFDEEVKRLGVQVHYESFPRSGHEGFYTEPHVIDAVTGESVSKN